MVIIKISPQDKNRYKVGQFYLKEIGDHLVLLKCKKFDGTNFIFDEIIEIED